jgi:DNA-directed RNA polymerase I, II, and III subunit RPABC2
MENDDGAEYDDDVPNELGDSEIPVITTEAVTPGNPGDPLEVLYRHHPETILDYAETVLPLLPLQQVPPSNSKLDAHHTSQPFLSVYEKTKILGFRSNQLAQGARPYVVVPEHVTATLDIAKLELEQRRLPFIIKRPMPNGSFEYWRLNDLMIL